MKKHKFSISQEEQIYAKKYGELPDTTFIKLYHEKGSDIAGEVVQQRMHAICLEMKREYETQLERECPFLT